MLQKSKALKSVSYAKYGYYFSIPFIVAFLVFMLYPTIFTAILGFTDFKGVATTTYHFLKEPFANFASILQNKTFLNALANTVIIWLMNFIPQLGLAMLLTAWFTSSRRRIRGQGAFKVMFYLPNIITAATVAVLFAAIFGYPVGPVNDLIKTFGGEAFYFTNDALAAKLIVAFIQFWMWYGYTTIILISGVLGINPELFEAAEIDGASSAQTFWRVTIPCLRNIMIFTLITSLIGGLNMFDIPKLFIWNGGPANATMTTSVFIYSQAFSGTYLYNTAAAASMIMFVIIALLSGLIFFLMRDRYEVRLRKAARRARREMLRARKEAHA